MSQTTKNRMNLIIPVRAARVVSRAAARAVSKVAVKAASKVAVRAANRVAARAAVSKAARVANRVARVVSKAADKAAASRVVNRAARAARPAIANTRRFNAKRASHTSHGLIGDGPGHPFAFYSRYSYLFLGLPLHTLTAPAGAIVSLAGTP